MSEVLEVLKGWLCLFIWVGALCAFGGLIHLGERKARRDPEFALWWSWLKQGEKWGVDGHGYSHRLDSCGCMVSLGFDLYAGNGRWHLDQRCARMLQGLERRTCVRVLQGLAGEASVYAQ